MLLIHLWSGFLLRGGVGCPRDTAGAKANDFQPHVAHPGAWKPFPSKLPGFDQRAFICAMTQHTRCFGHIF